MEIQASHMNLSFMQQLKAKKEQGLSLGSAESLLEDSPGLRLGQGLQIDPAHAGLTPAAEALAKAPGQQDKFTEVTDAQPQELTLGATFANEIVRRMEEAAGDEGLDQDPSDLRHSLGQAMDWIRERFGDETAAAAAGMVLQSTSNGVNEESLGDGLLNTLKFIDRNFGFAAGDAAISKFNNGVNVAINDYFDNGESEIFFAAPAPTVDGTSATQDLSVRTFMRAAESLVPEGTSEADLNKKLLDDLKSELDEVAELQSLSSQLEQEFSPTQAVVNTAMAAYTQDAAPVTPQFTSIAV